MKRQQASKKNLRRGEERGIERNGRRREGAVVAKKKRKKRKRRQSSKNGVAKTYQHRQRRLTSTIFSSIKAWLNKHHGGRLAFSGSIKRMVAAGSIARRWIASAASPYKRSRSRKRAYQHRINAQRTLALIASAAQNSAALSAARSIA